MSDTENKEIQTCELCGCVEDLVELEINGETKHVCTDCAYELGWRVCDECGQWVREDDIVVVNRDTRHEAFVCQQCADEEYYRCDDCGDYFSAALVRLDGYEHCVCDACYASGDYITCDDCGRITRDYVYNETDDRYYCDNCESNHASEPLHEYGYKPTPEFHFTESERLKAKENGINPTLCNLTFGVELEVDDGDDANDLCDDLAGLDMPIYMKHDGSLHSEGVEIVTHPGSLAWHMNGMDWDGVMRACTDNGYKSHDTSTCGLHIHVGFLAMGTDTYTRRRTAGNLVLLSNAVWDKLVRFTRRKESELDDWAKRTPVDIYADMDDEQITKEAVRVASYSRYSAVNLTNANTAEFRIFKGTLKRDTLIASIQLVRNMTRYAMTHTPRECTQTTWQDILAVSDYNELREYSRAKGLS